MSEDIHAWTNGRYTLMFDEHTFLYGITKMKNK